MIVEEYCNSCQNKGSYKCRSCCGKFHDGVLQGEPTKYRKKPQANADRIRKMTRDEAIQWIERIMAKYIHGGDESFDAQRKEALDMAIAALREQEEQENPKPLTLDELRQMEGEPVFMVDLVHKSDPTVSDLWGGWIVFSNHNQYGFTPRGGGFFSNDAYGENWLAYRSKPKEE